MSHTGRRRIRAFTLLEILVVVSLTAIIALITIPTLRSHLQKAKVNKTRLLISTLENSIWSYYADTGQFPPSGSDFLQECLLHGLVNTDKDETRIEAGRTSNPHWNGPYITLDNDQLLKPGDLEKKMPRFLDGTPMISSSARSGSSFIVDSWGTPFLYVNSETMLWAAMNGNGQGYQGDGNVGPYYPAWHENEDGQLSISPPRNRDEVKDYHNYSAGKTAAGGSKAFQLYSVGADGKTRSGDGGPGTLSIHDGRDNDGDGLIDEKDNDRSTRNGTPPE
ncbi:MAG TPA: prepilin-type N-terminal cleavage/methylation domain-containing protein, partial [bacterium]|nr:prepilin-type N-terminal cleavage/methylation domain-containing protein [bacterium]